MHAVIRTPLATVATVTDMADVTLSRRSVLKGAAAIAGATAFPLITAAPAAAINAVADTAEPFLLGVASGDPLPDGSSCGPGWCATFSTRRPAGAADRGGLAGGPRRAVPAGRSRRCGGRPARARPLRPRGRAGPVARARVLLPVSRPRRDQPGRAHPHGTRTRSDPSRLRLAIANCQDFQNGYWPAYRGLADEDVDVVFHLGDYIYEYDPHSVFPDRGHTTPETPGLDQLQHAGRLPQPARAVQGGPGAAGRARRVRRGS